MHVERKCLSKKLILGIVQTDIENGCDRCCVFVGHPPKDEKTQTKEGMEYWVHPN